MLERFQLLKNIGQFDNAVTGAQLPSLTRLSLIYGENGRGKTTLASILKSASTGDAVRVMERKRLASPNPPEIVLTVGGANRTFQNGSWNVVSPEVLVFDDDFVAANVCSGITLEAGHRQNLHELILGAQGVSLNATLRGHVTRIEEHNKSIRQRENAISAATRGTVKIDNFCTLPNEEDIDEQIANAERALAAARNAQAIQSRAPSVAPNLPVIDIGQIDALLVHTLTNVQANAMAQVRQHIGLVTVLCRSPISLCHLGFEREGADASQI